MTDAIDWFNGNSMARDAFSLIAGEKLGEGIHRTVHRCNFDPNLVVKFEHAAGTFANIFEWDLWNSVKDNRLLRRWFAPCVTIGDSGIVLLQRYTQDITEKQLPKKIPVFFTDLKISNWGLFEGRPVARDYGNNLATYNGLTDKLKKANWHS